MTQTQKPEMALVTKNEHAVELAAIVASAAPWIGGPISEIIGGVATNLKLKRVTDFIGAVLAYVEELHNAASEKFVATEDFIDIFEKTAQAVAEERYEEKRHLFANYLLNNIADPRIAYNQRLNCLRLLQDVDIRHIDLIKALLQSPSREEKITMMSAPSTVILRRALHLNGDQELQEVMHTTNTLGLTTLRGEYMNVNMTGDGAARLDHNVTPLGKMLMKLIREKNEESTITE